MQDLEQCVNYIKYMRESKEQDEPEIPMPDDLKDGKDRMVFGNIEAIFEWHRDFFRKNLEKSIENPVDLGNLFKKYDRKFQMYVVYCQNKPKSEFIVSEYIDTYFEVSHFYTAFMAKEGVIRVCGFAGNSHEIGLQAAPH